MYCCYNCSLEKGFISYVQPALLVLSSGASLIDFCVSYCYLSPFRHISLCGFMKGVKSNLTEIFIYHHRVLFFFFSSSQNIYFAVKLNLLQSVIAGVQTASFLYIVSTQDEPFAALSCSGFRKKYYTKSAEIYTVCLFQQHTHTHARMQRHAHASPWSLFVLYSSSAYKSIWN